MKNISIGFLSPGVEFHTPHTNGPKMFPPVATFFFFFNKL